ncbi:chitooligosaccharidolytic beta-N-acetylglucosaminidase isoform X2 [Plodia interpunctella]|uniref:chitooligosaccharidolytic beta-N-acetylglucosaminidase isoform X2 n=1 Tax=Plodia interpunctella TaxID=58824 RepID=UPI002368CEC6|nr:chitooligosaccharidolytic beta-N-acetylglucosaminidase isoform X2 [Plodia interpunctella]
MWSIRIFLVTFYVISSYCDEQTVWRWTCDSGKCLKMRTDPQSTEPALTLEACKMFCSEFGLLWPRPTGEVKLGNFLSRVNLQNLKVVNQKRGLTDTITDTAVERFKNQIRQSIPRGVRPKNTGKSVDVYLVNNNPNTTAFSLTMDESYSLNVGAASTDKINATVTANSFFGLRHGLETLSQLFVYDNIRDHVLMVRDVTVIDSPVYPYRGLLLDTGRNFYTVESIKRTIDAMAAVKLNTFHWHITDSQSFPFVSKRRPILTKLGAASPDKTYSVEDIREVVEYALVRGVRVIPEFDAPAHVGEGWQDSNLTVCFKAEPWRNYCVEPPCGQFNPIKDELYQYLEDIYMDMAEAFKPDIFHMGGDEVSEKCWNSSTEIQQFLMQNIWGLDTGSFLKLWNYFQTKAQKKAYKAFGKGIPLILWTSTMTESAHVEEFLNKDEYIIQVWTKRNSPQINRLLQKGYRLILSNYDALYLDCGFGAWVGDGHNWCAPYIPWQKIYDNSPAEIAPDHKKLILGGEAALWSEQSDSATLDGRLWPRAAALAERLWAEPATNWRDAETGMLHVRERLVRMGVQAEGLQPDWCYQNEGYCY